LALSKDANGMSSPIDVPSAEECRVSPRPIEELAQLGKSAAPFARSETPAVHQTTDAALATPDAVDGYPRAADARTTAAITEVIREFVACINAGATQRGFSLITDDFARRALFPFGPEELTEGKAAAIAAVNPLPPDELEGLRGFGEVTLVSERLAFVPVVTEKVSVLEAEPDHEPWLFVLVKVGDRWLIDNYGLPMDVAPSP
jgi:hypothetical protein